MTAARGHTPHTHGTRALREIVIIRELLAMRRSGQLSCIWCDAGDLRVEMLDGTMLNAYTLTGYETILRRCRKATAPKAESA